MTSVRRGRRAGAPDTKAAIVAAARDEFAAKGFRAATVRGIAAKAGVDAALIHHYFGSKDRLFFAAMAFPFDPRERLAEAAQGSREEFGRRLLEVFFSVWEDPVTSAPMVAFARGVGDPESGALLRDAILELLLGPAVQVVAPDRHSERAALLASQMLGIVMLRYVLQVEPLASHPVAQLIEIYAPTVQRYVVEPLPERGG